MTRINLQRVWLGAMAGLVLAGLTGCQSSGSSAPAVQPNQPGFTKYVSDKSVTIYPTVIGNASLPGKPTYSSEEAMKLGEWVKTTSTVTVAQSDEQLKSATPWGADYRNRGRDGIKSLEAHVQANPVTTDYAALAVYQINPEGGATAIYLFMVTKEGKLASWFEANRGYSAFREANPRTPADCTNLLVNIIANRVKIREETRRIHGKSGG